MVFVNKVTCNFFALVVVIINTKNTISKKANLFNCFSCFPIIIVFAKFNFRCFAFNQINARTAAIIYDETDVSKDLHQSFVDAFQNFGGQITFQSGISPGDSNVTEILRGVEAAAPDLLYLPVFEPEANLIASRIPEILGLQDVSLMGGMGLFNACY